MSAPNAFDSLPPAPDDLWPRISSVTPSAESLVSQVFPASLPEAAGILGRAVHMEMQSSGEYAAKAAMPPANMRPHELHLRRVELRFHSHLHAEGASRLLNSYAVVRSQVAKREPCSLPSPDDLRMAATRTYRMAVRDELAVQQQIRALKGELPGFNDELFGQLKMKTAGHGAKHHR